MINTSWLWLRCIHNHVHFKPQHTVTSFVIEHCQLYEMCNHDINECGNALADKWVHESDMFRRNE